ncbi:hypothetical protein YC2023_104506 [Brassica napus]|uniref:Uncharacterized protein n=1 Tax=Brassica oleracea TaxID=3712 RepID=A0A3P6GHT1_BRAOL|nr:unnamed protein product [Brassica oleracea]
MLDDQRTNKMDSMVDLKVFLKRKKRGTSKSSSKARVKRMLSFQSTDPILHNEPLISQVPQSTVAVTNPTLPSGSFFTQLLHDFDKNYGDGSSKVFDKNYGDGS